MFKQIHASCNFIISFPLADVPSAPEGPLEASDVTADSVVLKWRPPLKTGGLDLTGYIIERRDKKWSSWAPVETVKPDINSYTVQNLTTNNEYFFRVLAQNPEGISTPLESRYPVIPRKAPGKVKIPSNCTDSTW